MKKLINWEPSHKQTNKQTLRSSILIMSLVLVCSFSNAQISVNSSGNVKLAGDLNVDKTTPNTSWLYPDETERASLGISNRKFLNCYSKNVYATNINATTIDAITYKANVTFRATDAITISSDFTLPLGSSLNLITHPCPQ